MNPHDTPTSPEPPIPLSPEDDPRLEAIEALEAHVVDPNPGPLELDKPAAKPVIKPPITVSPPKPVAPQVTHLNPVKLAPSARPVIPIAAKPIVAPPTPTPAPIQEIKKVEEKPKAPKTPAAEMAEELANAPSTRPQFQFFLRQKASRKQIGIAIAIVVIIIVGVGAYLGYKALQ